MGLFSSIGKAIQEGKQKAQFETMRVSEKIMNTDLSTACFILEKELINANSLPMRSSLTKLFHERLKATDNSNELYQAFIETYERGRRNSRDMYAANMAQMIGKKLYKEDDYRVEANSEENYFRPRY